MPRVVVVVAVVWSKVERMHVDGQKTLHWQRSLPRVDVLGRASVAGSGLGRHQSEGSWLDRLLRRIVLWAIPPILVLVLA